MVSSSTTMASWSATSAPAPIRSSASNTAVPTVGCPANGSSCVAVKIRTLADAVGLVGFNRNTVSDRLNSRAIICIAAEASASPSLTTARPLPANGRSVKTSSRV
jgi:hypothetical protein